MNYLLDTHVWLWAIREPEKLSSVATNALLDGASSLAISCITYWEIAMLCERGALVGEDPREWSSYARAEMSVRELPITRQIAFRSRLVDVPHQDPADRFIAATALEHDLILITRDARLLDAPELRTVVA